MFRISSMGQHLAQKVCRHLPLARLQGLRCPGHLLRLPPWVVFLHAGHPFSQLPQARPHGCWVELWRAQNRELRKQTIAWRECWPPTIGGQRHTKCRISFDWCSACRSVTGRCASALGTCWGQSACRRSTANSKGQRRYKEAIMQTRQAWHSAPHHLGCRVVMAIPQAR